MGAITDMVEENRKLHERVAALDAALTHVSRDAKGAMAKVAELEAEVAGAKIQVQRLWTALERYGRHYANCKIQRCPAFGPLHDCTCGLDDARKDPK